MMTKTVTTIINILYVTVVVLFLFDRQSHFEIKSQFIKSFVYLGLLIGTPFVLIWNVFVFKTRRRKILGLMLPILILILIFIIGPLKILFSASAWRTQTILYQNENLKIGRAHV